MIISVFPYLENENAIEITRSVLNELSMLDCSVYVTDECENLLSDYTVTFGDIDKIMGLCDIAVAVGGDGTTLRIAKKAALHNKNVLGINGGRLGFMSGIEANELHLLRQVIVEGRYSVENRMMLRADIFEQDKLVDTYHCLNDMVVTRGDFARLIDIDISCENREVLDVRADGVIISTPTGSTAYSMAAGGPIVSPDTDCFIVTPICPHSLIDRSIVFPSNKELEVCVHNDVNNNAVLTADGKTPLQITSNSRIVISKSEYVAKLIKIKPDNFYEIIKKKIIERRT